MEQLDRNTGVGARHASPPCPRHRQASHIPSSSQTVTKVELNLHQAIPLLQSNEPVAYLMLLILSSEGKADAGICRGWACGHRQAVSLPSLSPNYKWPKHGVPEPGTGHLQYLTRSQSSMNMGYLNAWTL